MRDNNETEEIDLDSVIDYTPELIQFLEDNEQYGDDWSEGMKFLEAYQSILTKFRRTQLQYEELKEALIGDSPNWTHDEVVQQALELASLNHNN